MILQLQPDQIAGFWDALRHGLIVANRVPPGPGRQTYLNKVLEQLLIGKAQAWVGFETRNGEKVFYAFGITTIREDELTGERQLFLHTLYAFRPIPEDMLSSMVPELERFAREVGCTMMLTITSIDRLKAYYTECGFTQDPALYIKRL